MLMLHMVGFPGGFDTDVLDASKFDPDYLKEIMLKKWICPPNTQRHYEDAGYYILSRIVSKISGKQLLPFCWENIFLDVYKRQGPAVLLAAGCAHWENIITCDG